MCPHMQPQYIFAHDALDELITCGETDIPAAGLKVKVNRLRKTIPGKGITGFTEQFQVDITNLALLPYHHHLFITWSRNKSYSIKVLNEVVTPQLGVILLCVTGWTYI